MKKNLAKLLPLLMAAAMILTLAACGPKDGAATPTPAQNANNGSDPTPTPEASATDWTKFDGWLSESWDAKTVSYQFTGDWALPENGFYFEFCINLYSDGSAVIDQRNTGTASSYRMFGCWSEENTEDGNEITFDTLHVTGLNGDLEAHEYNYVLYEESDGGYSFGYTFGIIPGQYFRTVDVAGGSAVTYASFEDFHAAVDGTAPQTSGEDGDGEDAGDGDSAGYAAHTMVLPFTPDTSEQLKTEFYCAAGTWGAALGTSGEYTPTDSADVLFSWVSDGSENYHLDFKADGTYEYQFTTVNATETGTWSFTGWTLTAITANGNTFTASITG